MQCFTLPALKEARIFFFFFLMESPGTAQHCLIHVWEWKSQWKNKPPELQPLKDPQLIQSEQILSQLCSFKGWEIFHPVGYQE